MSAGPVARFRAAFVLGLALISATAVTAQAHSDAAQDNSLFGAYLAGRQASDDRDNEEAARYFREALERDPNNEFIMEQIFLLDLATGKVEAAGELAKAITKIDGTHKLARLTLAVEALRARQFKSARRHLEQSGDSDPVAALSATFLRAWAHQGAGETDEALALLGEENGSEWQRLYSAYMAALIADVAGRKGVAQSKFEEATAKPGASARVIDAYARFLMRDDQWAAAEKLVADAEAAFTNNPLVAVLRADLDARRRPEPLVASAIEGAGEALYSIGAALGRESDEDLAIVYLRLSLHLQPAGQMALLALAELYENLKQYDEAIALFMRMPETSAMRSYAEIQAAFNLNSADRKDEAVAQLENLLQREPNLQSAIIALGNIEQGRKNWMRAAEMFSKAISLAGGGEEASWTLYYWRGICYERAKQWDKAEADFKLSLKLNPDEPLVLNYLGYSWIDQGVNLDEGLELIKKAVAGKPGDGYIVDSLGWAYYKLGDYEAAVRELERAVELRPEDPTINDHLGDAYWRAGRKLEARFQWSHARDLDPEPEQLSEIMAKLKDGLADEPAPSRATVDADRPAPANRNGG